MNKNDLLLLDLANRADSNATLPVVSSRLPANVVYSGGLTTLLSSNPFVFSGGSNYLGTFTNVFAVNPLAAIGGTNQVFTNLMSVDGGTTWTSFYRTNLYTFQTVTNIGTNYFGTNSLVYTNFSTNTLYSGMQLAILSGPTSTGSVSVVALEHQELASRLTQFAGQTLDFSDATVAGALTTNLQFTFGTTRTNTLCFSNGLLMRVTQP